MLITLENAHVRLTINPTNSTWSAESAQIEGPYLRNARLGVTYRVERKPTHYLRDWHTLSVGDPETIASPHGPLHQRTLQIGPDRAGLRGTLTFALTEEHPLLLWKIRLDNEGRKPVYVKQIEMLRAGFISVREMAGRRSTARGRRRSVVRGRGRVRPHPKGNALAFFSNGWGSWNHTGAYGFLDNFQRTRLGPFTSPMRVNAGTPQPRRFGHFASDMFGVLGDRTFRTGILAGFLSQRQHFGSLETFTDPANPALRMWANGDDARLDPGAAMETDWACLHFLHLDRPDPLAPYLDAVARENPRYAPVKDAPALPVSAPFTGAPAQIPTGWCSWYHYFQNISADAIRQNLHAASEVQSGLPLQLIQIDDGYQTQIGDWLTFKDTFPHGPSPLADDIRAAGFTPGIWLAPFIVHSKSRLAAEHPDWLLEGKFRRPANAGFVWGNFNRALDLTHPPALDYVREVIHTAVHEWGYPYLKLDFLYAAALPGQYRDATRTRAQVLRAGLEAIREAAGPETTLLGCGCPLGPAVGLFDAMRIGADVAPDWYPKYKVTHLVVKKEPDSPATRNAVQNALTRAPLHRRWWVNDPDCLLLRPETALTLPEVQTLATVIALSGGSVLLSGDLPALPPERLRIAQALLPLIGQAPHVLDWFDSPTPTRLQLDLDGPAGRWHVLALFNWSDKPRILELRPQHFYLDVRQAYHARAFWTGEVYRVPAVESNAGEAGALAFRDVPPHGCVLLALRPVRGHVQYLGSDLHVSQGLEVADWQAAPDTLAFTLTRPGPAAGEVALYLPRAPRITLLNNAPLSAHAEGEGIYRLPVQFDGEGRVALRF